MNEIYKINFIGALMFAMFLLSIMLIAMALYEIFIEKHYQHIASLIVGIVVLILTTYVLFFMSL